MFDEYSHLNIINSQYVNNTVYVNLSNENTVHDGEFLKTISRYDTFGNKDYIFKTNKPPPALPINNLKYYNRKTKACYLKSNKDNQNMSLHCQLVCQS